MVECFNVAEVARLAGVTQETVRRNIRSGRLKAMITSRRVGYLVTRQNLVMWVVSRSDGWIDVTDECRRKEVPRLKLRAVTINK